MIKICEVVNFKDDEEWLKLNQTEKARVKQIEETRDLSLKLLQQYSGFLKRQDSKKLLMEQSIKINDFARKNPVQMLFRIMTIVPVGKIEKQNMLEINGFDKRLNSVYRVVNEKIQELKNKKTEIENTRKNIEEDKTQMVKKYMQGKGLISRKGAQDDEIAKLK